MNGIACEAWERVELAVSTRGLVMTAELVSSGPQSGQRATAAQQLTHGRRLAKNSVHNLLGQGVPLVAAFFAIPLLIRSLGTDRFGVLTLAWIIIGYFSLFDLGLGRALTQVVAAELRDGSDTQAPPFVWPTLVVMFLLGLVGCFVVVVVAPTLVFSVLKIPVGLQAESVRAFYLLGAGIPIVVLTAGLVGILAAFQRFGVVNAIRAPMGVYTYAAPLLVLPFSHSLVPVTGILVFGRVLACFAYSVACSPSMPTLSSGTLVRLAEVKPLFRLGIWMTISNIIGPLMLYLDRFVIGAVVTVAAVAYYATPYEMVTKLLIVPGAILGVLFPAFAASYRQDHARTVRLFSRGTKYIALLLFPVVFLITAFAHEGLQWWVGPDFARHSTSVLQWLAIGVFINALAQLFATLVQGVARPDITAKLHTLELPLYVAVLWWAIHRFGILGAAIAWTARVALDGGLLLWITSAFLGDSAMLLRRIVAGLSLALVALIVPLVVPSLIGRVALALLVSVVFVLLAWFVILAADERAIIAVRMGIR